MTDDVTAPPLSTQTFGGMKKVSKGQTIILLTIQGVTFKGTCVESPSDPAFNMASIIVSANEEGTWYSSLNIFGGDVTEVDPPAEGVSVFSYDAGCDAPGGPFLFGGLSFTVNKPSGIAINGVMSIGVGVLGADAVFSGMVIL